MIRTVAFLALFTLSLSLQANSSEKSVARKWVDMHLYVISQDGQGPTIQARNLFHMCVAMYDAWAVYDPVAEPYFLGKQWGDFQCEFDPNWKLAEGLDRDSAMQITINYAAHRVIRYRYVQFGSKGRTIDPIDSLFLSYGYPLNNHDKDYMNGSPEALGNYIADCIIQFGLTDGSNEEDWHQVRYYTPVNRKIEPQKPGAQGLHDPNHWQPISILRYLEERGDPSLLDWNRLLLNAEDVFLTPEWGDVQPFALTEKDKKVVDLHGNPVNIYLDPGHPPYLDYVKDSLASEQYKWGFLVNALWSSKLDPSQTTMIDISPGARGNIAALPAATADYPQFYDLENGGDYSKGHALNPATGKPYEKNVVPLADYARVIAEYWVDGVNTYAPPGHWFHHLNLVADHPDFEHRWKGEGPILDRLEWDIKSYFTLGGAMHDAGIAAWGVKGYYDYVRPISAIRYMAEKGQCSDPELPNYHQLGLPLIKGKIELVGPKDPLVGPNKEHLNKVKIYSWKGPQYINDPFTETAGVDWILAENWWPYQRYTFTTPPFAGYVSGHSTFSLAGAEVLTIITGDPFFPGGMATFTAKKNEFLLFEDGPTVDVTLQWATYHDAAAETCLSRIWGGIHPPCDDIPGRKMGLIVGQKSVIRADQCFQGKP